MTQTQIEDVVTRWIRDRVALLGCSIEEVDYSCMGNEGDFVTFAAGLSQGRG